MKAPVESDFTVIRVGAGVLVVFKPTGSHYTFNLLRAGR
jgi:hypothetical protein